MYGVILGDFFFLNGYEKRAAVTVYFTLLILLMYLCYYSQIIPVFTFKASIGHT